MSWILKFRRAAAPPDEGSIFIRVECGEDGLQGEKESCALALEENSGEAWVCEDVRIFVPPGKEDRHDD